MPKIEVNEEVFYSMAGRRWDTREALEDALTAAKAELDEDSDKSLPIDERTLKIELNDTNRPDLWSAAGCARQIKCHNGGERPRYPFFSFPENIGKTARDTVLRRVIVEESVSRVRPFLAGFIARGKAVSDAALRDMIQTQEKLAWNFGRKRRTISMGLYRTAIIQWPIHYRGVNPDSVSFIPLQWDVPLTLREILKQHPKGKEYAFIQEHEALHPLLLDARGAVLSYPPIINSADLGAVQVGDEDLFIELTGTDQDSVTLAASIMACDLADHGYTIEPVVVDYEFDTPHGRTITTPYYFQMPVFCSLGRAEKFLGEKLSADECIAALAKMGVRAERAEALERGSSGQASEEGVLAYQPEYRNDYLHAADVMEDIMIGRNLASFRPERPRDFTIGRLTPITYFSRRVKECLIGLGYQEMIYNYLGSRTDLVEKMRGNGSRIIRIANPMTENYEYVRDSVLASLMISESISGRAAYPHRIFEIGKVAYLDDCENYETATRQYLGLVHTGQDANFNTIASQLQTVFYYLSREYEVEESEDPRFIPGRAAALIFKGKQAGVFGEIHPEVLENWGVAVPGAAAEIDLDAIL